MTNFNTFPGADAFRAFCIAQGYREQINEGLWDWLTDNGYTQDTLSDKVGAAQLDGFDFSVLGASWSPADLFAASEVGVWYDPSDFSTMYQDSAGTIPVTAVGQVVGRINDKSGNGFHATQATTGNKPYLRQDANGMYNLQFDGLDDFMTTAAIDFSATDKMSVFAGVRKLSDATRGICVENGVGGSIGSFNLECPGTSATTVYGSLLSGSALTSVQAATFAAPITNIVSVLSDLSKATREQELLMRVNAALPTLTYANATNAGTGTFGNYPLYIGRRAGTSLPFNGHLYSLIVRGALSDAGQITSAESYVNSKTKAYA